MNQPFLPFSRPSIGDEEIAAVEQVLRSGWITTGPKNQQLEEQFAQRVGCRHAVALSSATGAMASSSAWVCWVNTWGACTAMLRACPRFFIEKVLRGQPASPAPAVTVDGLTSPSSDQVLS